MNRRNAIIAGLAGSAAVATLVPSAHAAEKADNLELDDVHALLKAHDEAMTNHDLKEVHEGIAECEVYKAGFGRAETHCRALLRRRLLAGAVKPVYAPAPARLTTMAVTS